MRIIIATPFYPPEAGVLGMYAKGLEEAFKRRGDIVSIVPIRFERTLPAGIRHLIFFLRTLIHTPRASLVLALDTWSVGVPALIAAKLFRVPFAVRIGGDFLWESYVERTKEPGLLSEFYSGRMFSLKERLIYRMTRTLVERADALLFTTRFQRDIWQKAYGFSPKRARIVENYYPPDEGEATASASRVFVAAGRPIALKNEDMLARAFARVKVEYPTIALDARALPREEHRVRVRSAYAIIIPSLSEVCSNAAIEAALFGKPFIMSRDTGTSERLENCGLYIDTRKEEELVSAITSLLDPAVYEKLQRACRLFPYEHSWETMAGEILETINASRRAG